jgi:predicted PolB exonuclease-like 3'-5' exonuclease
MELFHFDIETVGQYKDFENFCINDKRGSDLFKGKYNKMNWSEKSQDIDDAYIQNAGIIPTYGKIACISFGYIDGSGEKQIRSFYGEDEKSIVESFNQLLSKIEKKSFKLCGFRINYFDIPWILHKLHKYDIIPSGIIKPYDKKPWELRIVDMSDDWKGKFAWSFTFDEMCYELGIRSPKDVISGHDVHKTYWTGEISKIKDYCEGDVSCSIDCGKKIYNI